MMSWDDDETIKRWLEHAATDMGPKMEASAVAISIVPPDMGDPKFWVELGAMICMDKPIILVAFGHDQIPEKLRRAADEIVLLPNGVDPAASTELAAAIERQVHGG